MRNPLSPFAHLSHEPDQALAGQACAKAWHMHGMIALRPEWLHSWADQKQAVMLAEKLWGKLDGKKG